MDPERLTEEHAFVRRAMPTAEDAISHLTELAADLIDAGWGASDDRAGRTNPSYGSTYWAHHARNGGGQPDSETWRSMTFEWCVTTDECRETGSNAIVFYAGATALKTRDNPAAEPDNAGWLDQMRARGFEHVNDAG